MSVYLKMDGLVDFATYLAKFPEETPKAALMAINQTADRRALQLAREEMSTQIAFPKGYLNADRLGVSKRATSADLEAVISGRDRPTSLARFVVGSTLPKRRPNGLQVIVTPGETRSMGSAFTVRLNNGNIGVALRVKPGEQVKGKKFQARPFGKDLYLLYGPSVDQVFRDVRSQILPEAGEYLADEFLRQLNRLIGD